MFGLGSQEIIVVLIVALLVFGPQELPKIGKQIGQAMREFQNMQNDVQRAFTEEDTGYNRGYTSQTFNSIAAPKYADHHEPEAQPAAIAAMPAAEAVHEHESTHTSPATPALSEDKEEKAG